MAEPAKKVTDNHLGPPLVQVCNDLQDFFSGGKGKTIKGLDQCYLSLKLLGSSSLVSLFTWLSVQPYPMVLDQWNQLALSSLVRRLDKTQLKDNTKDHHIKRLTQLIAEAEQQ